LTRSYVELECWGWAGKSILVATLGAIILVAFYRLIAGGRRPESPRIRLPKAPSLALLEGKCKG